jgi:hypothetical protein
MRPIALATCLLAVFVSCRPNQQATSESFNNAQPPTRVSDPTIWDDLEPEQMYKLSDEIFSDNVHRIDIHMLEGTFNRVTRHLAQGGDACRNGAPYGHIEKVEFTRYRSDGTSEIVEFKDAGIRVRGNTSCGKYVKQYRIKFTEAKDLFKNEREPVTLSNEDKKRVKKQSLYGLKSISLRNSENDPTFLRDGLASEVFAYGDELQRVHRAPGAPARGGSVYRVGYVKAYLHFGSRTIALGLFNTAEQIDKTLYKSRFGKGKIDYAFQTNLAKGDLVNIPRDDAKLFEAYEPDIVGGEDWDPSELPTQPADARQMLTDLITRIKDADEARDLETLVDVDSVINYMIAANLTGHWDSLQGNANNDYLIHNKTTGLWQIVVWDLDNTFGSIATNNSRFDTMWNTPFDQFKAGNEDLLDERKRPLFAKIMKYFKPRYVERYKEFLAGIYELHAANRRIENRRDMLIKYGKVPMLENYSGDKEKHPQFEMLFSFKNHRWGHATCGIFHGGKVAKKVGLNVDVNYNNKTVSCQ